MCVGCVCCRGRETLSLALPLMCTFFLSFCLQRKLRQMVQKLGARATITKGFTSEVTHIVTADQSHTTRRTLVCSFSTPPQHSHFPSILTKYDYKNKKKNLHCFLCVTWGEKKKYILGVLRGVWIVNFACRYYRVVEQHLEKKSSSLTHTHTQRGNIELGGREL